MTPGAMLQQLRVLRHRLNNLVARFVLGAVNDGGRMQFVRGALLDGEEVADAEHVQPYGTTFHPLPGAEAIAVFPFGDRSHPLIVAIADRRHRVNGLAPGEVAIYTHENPGAAGHRIVLRHGNRIEIFGREVEGRTTERITWHSDDRVEIEGLTITVVGEERVRVAAPDVEIFASERLTLDCGGNGWDLTPTSRTDHVAGAAVTTTALHPPRIRED